MTWFTLNCVTKDHTRRINPALIQLDDVSTIGPVEKINAALGLEASKRDLAFVTMKNGSYFIVQPDEAKRLKEALQHPARCEEMNEFCKGTVETWCGTPLCAFHISYKKRCSDEPKPFGPLCMFLGDPGRPCEGELREGHFVGSKICDAHFKEISERYR